MLDDLTLHAQFSGVVAQRHRGQQFEIDPQGRVFGAREDDADRKAIRWIWFVAALTTALILSGYSRDRVGEKA